MGVVAVSATLISSSERGSSMSLHPSCIGVNRSESTLESPSEQDDSMQSSTVSSRPSVEATHKSFWFSCESVSYPAD